MSTKTFEGDIDRYNGVTVDLIKEPCEITQFSSRLMDSLKKWDVENRRCIWFKVNIKDSATIPILANEGFNFHHSRDNFVLMYKWLPKDDISNLPPASHTNLGVGGLVLNDNNEMLVVKEKHFKISHWKLPGGYVERGEDIKDAALREVKEETGIDAVFESMVTLRHSHNAMFANSDIYVVVLLRATSTEITTSNEIKACQWMDINEYLNHPDVIDYNKKITRQALDLMERKIKFNLIEDLVTVGTFTKNITCLVLEDLKNNSVL